MSELINTNRNEHFRCALLTGGSMLALVGAMATVSAALAADDEHPTVWIELGGQLERVDSKQAIFSPAFFNLASPPILDALTGAQRPPRYSTGAEGAITLLPKGSNWALSVAVRYGRAGNARHKHYQTGGLPTITNTSNLKLVFRKPSKLNLGDSEGSVSETHFVMDFRAGKDVGLGMFGREAQSVFSAGVRYAQFTSSAHTTLAARAYGFNAAYRYKANNKYHSIHKPVFQSYTAVVNGERSTHALGPSLSWEVSLPVAGHEDNMVMALDWGVNAAALFGRQRTREDHHVTGYSQNYNGKVKVVGHSFYTTAHDRSRSAFIPNVGGFAGLSLKFPNARVSLGYRGDFFFNAMDMGFNTRDITNRNFYGPFATISIGLGG